MNIDIEEKDPLCEFVKSEFKKLSFKNVLTRISIAILSRLSLTCIYMLTGDINENNKLNGFDLLTLFSLYSFPSFSMAYSVVTYPLTSISIWSLMGLYGFKKMHK